MPQGDSEDGSGDNTGDNSAPSVPQKAVMVISVALALVLLGYAGWQILYGSPPSSPEASVVDTSQLPDGEVAVTVRIRNSNDRGLVRATVEADCADPPPQIEFTYVPSHDTRTATLVCPPATSNPNATVVAWVQR